MSRRADAASSLSQTESEIRGFLAVGDHAAAANTLLRSYSNEILGYLINVLRDRELARDAFASFARDLWQGLPGVNLRATARAWAYALARNAAHRVQQAELRRRRHEAPISDAEALAGVQPTRTLTPPYLRTENKLQLARLRERLTLEEREIVTLRVDRGFEWREIAVALAGTEVQTADAAGRYRKRFQLIRRKLAQWLREDPLQSSSDQK